MAQQQTRPRLLASFWEGIFRAVGETIASLGQDAGKKISTEARKALLDQLAEGMGGAGPKDEGTYGNVVTAILNINPEDSEAGPRIMADIDEWIGTLEIDERNWLIRVMANRVVDTTASQGNGIDLIKAAGPAALQLVHLSVKYPSFQERTEIARAQGLIKRNPVRKTMSVIGRTIHVTQENYAEAGKTLKKHFGQTAKEKKECVAELEDKLKKSRNTRQRKRKARLTRQKGK